MNTIGIALATYNGAEYISAMLDSIASQSYQNFIIHVCDDGSRDDTVNIIKKHGLYADGKILIHLTNGGNGAHKNFKRTIEFCQEPYISLCDQDDFWVEDKLEVLMNEMRLLENGSNKPLLVFSDLEIVDSNLGLIHRSFYEYTIKNSNCKRPGDFMISNHIPGCAMLFNRTLKNIFEPMPDDVRMHDWWIVLIASCYGEVHFVNKPLIKYRQHSNNTIGVPGVITGNGIIYRLRAVKGVFKNLSKVKALRSELIKKSQEHHGINDEGIRLTKLNVFNRLHFLTSSVSGEVFIVKFMMWILI